MCGLFGAVRCSDPSHARFVFDIVCMLGKESEERGIDASGLAFAVASEELPEEYTVPTKTHVKATHRGLDKTFIVKNQGKFSDLDFDFLSGDVFAVPTILIGHTRWASQGNTSDLANASPMYAGALVGTHNGDVDKVSLSYYAQSKRKAFGSTDTEFLLRALDKGRHDRRLMTRVFRRMQGRAALAFYDRTRPDRLYLARTAIAPLCYAYDQFDNFYYASNPDWFRRIENAYSGVEFHGVTLIPEGTLLTVSTITGEVTDVRRFTPTVRENDVRIANIVAYRGFTAADKALDLRLQRHLVASPPLVSWPEPVALPDGNGHEEYAQSALFSSPAAGNEPLEEDEDQAVVTEYELIDWDEIDALCWFGRGYDSRRFETILTAGRAEALRLISDLREDAALFKSVGK